MPVADIVWGASSVTKASPDASWNTSTHRLTFNVAGLFEIKLTQRHQSISDLFSVDSVIGARSDLADIDSSLSYGARHYVPAIVTVDYLTAQYWYEDTFYYTATEDEVIDLTLEGQSAMTGDQVDTVSMEVSVRKL